MVYRWNDSDRGKHMYLEKNPPQRHTVHHKFYTDWPGGSYLVLCNERLITMQLATVSTCIMYDSTLFKYGKILSTSLQQFLINNCLNVH